MKFYLMSNAVAVNRDAFTSKPEIKACGGLFVVNLWRPQQEASTQNQFFLFSVQKTFHTVREDRISV